MRFTINRINDKFEIRIFIDNVSEDQEHHRTSPAKKEYWKIIAKHPKNLLQLYNIGQFTITYIKIYCYIFIHLGDLIESVT